RAVAEEGDRAQVALGQAGRADQVPRRGLQLFRRVRQIHVEELRRVLEAREVLAQAEHRRAVRRLVGANPLEDARAVVQAVRADVDRRVGPVDELPVHPDLRGLLHASLECYPSVRSASSAPLNRTTSDGASPAMCRSEPAPTQTIGACRSDRSMITRATFGTGNGATAPGSKPVAERTSSSPAERA